MLLTYFIGLIITFIWVRSTLEGRDTFLPALIIAVLWPISIPLRLLFKLGM